MARELAGWARDLVLEARREVEDHTTRARSSKVEDPKGLTPQGTPCRCRRCERLTRSQESVCRKKLAGYRLPLPSGQSAVVIRRLRCTNSARRAPGPIPAPTERLVETDAARSVGTTCVRTARDAARRGCRYNACGGSCQAGAGPGLQNRWGTSRGVARWVRFPWPAATSRSNLGNDRNRPRSAHVCTHGDHFPCGRTSQGPREPVAALADPELLSPSKSALAMFRVSTRSRLRTRGRVHGSRPAFPAHGRLAAPWDRAAANPPAGVPASTGTRPRIPS